MNELNQLISIDTNSADDSTGVAFKLEGNLYIPVVISAMVSVGLLTLLIWGKAVPIPTAFAVGIAPFGATLFVVLAFFNGKRPHFASDLLAKYTTDESCMRHPKSQPEHPGIRVQQTQQK
jgi:hypothetical protein